MTVSVNIPRKYANMSNMNEREAFRKRYLEKDGKLKRKSAHKDTKMYITDEQAKDTQILVAKINALPYDTAKTLHTVVDLLTRRMTSNEYLDLPIIDVFMRVFVPKDRQGRSIAIEDLLNEYTRQLTNRSSSISNVDLIDPVTEADEAFDTLMADKPQLEMTPSKEDLLKQVDDMINDLSTQLLLLTNPRYRDSDIQSEFPVGSEDAIRYNLVKLNLIKTMAMLS